MSTIMEALSKRFNKPLKRTIAETLGGSPGDTIMDAIDEFEEGEDPGES